MGGRCLTTLLGQSQALKPGLGSGPRPSCVPIPRSCPGTGREAERPATPLCTPCFREEETMPSRCFEW